MKNNRVIITGYRHGCDVFDRSHWMNWRPYDSSVLSVMPLSRNKSWLPRICYCQMDKPRKNRLVKNNCDVKKFKITYEAV